MDTPKIDRLLRLMKLMSGNENYTIEELAKKLGITYRSVYRYIETFKSAGFVVIKLRSNVYKLAKMQRTHGDMKNLIGFTEEESYVIDSIIDGLHPDNQLKAGLKKKLASICRYAANADYIYSENVSRNIQEIGKAIREKKKVILKAYESANSGTISDRYVEPFEYTTNFIDIWAYDIEKCENLIFKISRIGSVTVLDEEWSHENKHQKSKTDCFRMSGFEQIPVKLELSLRAKNLLLEEYPLAGKDLKKEKDKWILETMVSNIAGVGRFYLGLADEIKIIDSPALIDYVKSQLEYIKKLQSYRYEDECK